MSKFGVVRTVNTLINTLIDHVTSKIAIERWRFYCSRAGTEAASHVGLAGCCGKNGGIDSLS